MNFLQLQNLRFHLGISASCYNITKQYRGNCFFLHCLFHTCKRKVHEAWVLTPVKLSFCKKCSQYLEVSFCNYFCCLARFCEESDSLYSVLRELVFLPLVVCVLGICVSCIWVVSRGVQCKLTDIFKNSLNFELQNNGCLWCNEIHTASLLVKMQITLPKKLSS